MEKRVFNYRTGTGKVSEWRTVMTYVNQEGYGDLDGEVNYQWNLLYLNTNESSIIVEDIELHTWLKGSDPQSDGCVEAYIVCDNLPSKPNPVVGGGVSEGPGSEGFFGIRDQMAPTYPTSEDPLENDVNDMTTDSDYPIKWFRYLPTKGCVHLDNVIVNEKLNSGNALWLVYRELNLSNAQIAVSTNWENDPFVIWGDGYLSGPVVGETYNHEEIYQNFRITYRVL